MSNDSLFSSDYKYGFSTNIESIAFEKGLNEEVIRNISIEKNEPAFLLDFRLKAYKKWLEMTPPDWANLSIHPIDYQNIKYFSKPK